VPALLARLIWTINQGNHTGLPLQFCLIWTINQGNHMGLPLQLTNQTNQPTNPMTPDIQARLRFIQAAERLKTVLRSGHTSTGRPESTAEHSWRLSLLALTFQDLLQPLNIERVLNLCLIHDLGEAISGDVPAIQQTTTTPKAAQERQDFIQLCAPLPPALQAEFLALWDEYEAAQTREARIVKALDKIETIIQHNQGANPPDFDYGFNLDYGRHYADIHPVIANLRQLVDSDTARHAEQQEQVNQLFITANLLGDLDLPPLTPAEVEEEIAAVRHTNLTQK
jgi:putative hydrolases of HD superfamily